jgi:hypothetical protein
MGITTIQKITNAVCKAIWLKLGPIYMKPPTKNQWNVIARDFWVQWGMPNCIGAIDGKHVKCLCPDNAGSMYFNYLKFHSLVLLAIVDAHCNFIYVDVGSQGSRSDGGIFQDCELNRRLETKQLNIPDPQPLPGTDVSVPFYFIGDNAFRSVSTTTHIYLDYF